MINDRYKIIKKIGQGRSKVFLCNDSLNDDIEMALKILPSNAPSEEIESFKEEFQILKSLEHPNIVRVGEFATIVESDESDKAKKIENGSKYFTLEYFNGENLEETISGMTEELLIEIISQICNVLFYIHSSNYIYYDLKFENILIKSNSDKPLVKLIDFGLTKNVKKLKGDLKRGTAEYMAPEILSEESIDHRIDFYSLGVILYKIIFEKFPASGNSEIEIFKQHIEKVFEFPDSIYSKDIIHVVKKLLNKKPEERYSTALEICNDFGKPLSAEKFSGWIPPHVFVINNVVVSIKSFLSNNEPENVLVIKGPEGSGKTHTSEEIYYNFENVILIQSNNSGNGIPLWNIILRRIYYSDFIYPKLSTAIRKQFVRILRGEYDNLLEELKAIFIYLSNKHDFILIFDDFNEYDPLTLDLLSEIIPILLVNNVRIIITEDSSQDSSSEQIASREELQITPFNEPELQSLLEKTFSSNYPLQKIKKAILEYSDSFPGMVINFLKTLFYFEVIKYNPYEILFELSKDKSKLLKSTHDDIYDIRLNNLGKDELLVSQTLSMLNVDVSSNTLELLLGQKDFMTSEIILSLQNKNILKSTITSDYSFTSHGLKQFIYKSVIGKKQRHLKIANVLHREVDGFSNVEIARHYELAEEYTLSYYILNNEIETAEKLAAYSYQKEMLLHLLDLPLDDKSVALIKYKLSQSYYKLKDNNEALKLTNELLEKEIEEERSIALLMQKGGCLIRLGEYAHGVNTYNSLLPRIKDHKSKNTLFTEIAAAETYLNEYDKAKEKCKIIIEKDNVTPQLVAKCLNILGIVEFQQSGNLDGAIEYFSEALMLSEKKSMKMNETEIETNIGNIYSMKGDYDKAEYHWQNALVKNSSIGSLSLEATLLMNYGILNFNKLEFEKSIENNKRAAAIFRSLGSKTNQGLILSNLGETYIMSCEYDNASTILQKAINIFEELEDKIEISEIYVLQGKLYYHLNDVGRLSNILKNYLALMPNKKFTIRQQNNLEFLKQLLHFVNNDEISFNQLTNLRDDYFAANDYGQYIQTNMFLIKHLIKCERYHDALKELEEEQFIDHINNKPFFELERIFLTSAIAVNIKDAKLKPQLDYLEYVYEKLKDKSITELTWQTLSTLAEVYMQRGFMKKAKEFIVLSKSLIDHIAINIKDVRQRNQYLAFPDRKSKIDKLDIWKNYIK